MESGVVDVPRLDEAAYKWNSYEQKIIKFTKESETLVRIYLIFY